MYSLERNVPRCRIFWLDGKKFKTNLFVFFFDLPLKRETATQTTLLAEVLKEGCKLYPDARALSIAVEEMYGALWDISIVKKGARQLLMFSLETAKAVDVEDAIGFLKALSTEPLVKNDAFSEEVVNRRKDILARRLASLKDDKRGYAQRRCLEEVAKGTPLEISADGYAEDLDQIDGKTLYKHYCNIVENGTVKVFFCGDEGEKGKLTHFRKIFKGGEPLENMKKAETLPKQEPVFIKEQATMEQARLLLAFDTKAEWDKRSYATMLVLNKLFGGDPDSLLFQNLRERDGLCYDIKSYTYPLTGLLFVQTGIKVQDAKKSAVGILKALEELGEDVVEPKKLEQAKTALLRQYNTIADQPWNMVDFSVEQVLVEGERGLDPFLRRIRNVTAEEVSRMANKARLRTIYLLSGKEAAENEVK